MPWACWIAISRDRRSRTWSSESCSRASMSLVTCGSPQRASARGKSSAVQVRKPMRSVVKKKPDIRRPPQWTTSTILGRGRRPVNGIQRGSPGHAGTRFASCFNLTPAAEAGLRMSLTPSNSLHRGPSRRPRIPCLFCEGDQTMQVKDVMTRGVECISPDATLQDAARKMRDLDVGPLPVCENDRLVGILTDRDIVVRAIAEGRDPQDSRVRDVMTRGIDYCFDDDDVAEAAWHMEAKQIRRLAVLDHNKRLVGIVSLGDLAVKSPDEHLTAEALEQVSLPIGTR